MMRYAGLGTELAAGIAAFTLIGYWVDHRFGTGDAGVITGAILGSVGGLYVFIRRAMELAPRDGTEGKHEKAKRRDDGDDGK